MSARGSTIDRVARKRPSPSPVLEALTKATQSSAELERMGLTAPGAPLEPGTLSPDAWDDAAGSADDTYREDEEP